MTSLTESRKTIKKSSSNQSKKVVVFELEIDLFGNVSRCDWIT